ncbi:MAG TPA: prepilin-type N-terminal cleavage/methylation domain-containing protein [Candidatus Paceibacterota bacterium]|nr:prepilin-type N-terminal cleavage/methylation domain-containing protein [Candidatus Paceibacterota bacterium]
MKTTNTSSRGFTLIELLVVIAIIGILSAVVLTSLNSARTKARDARRESDMKSVQLALELEYDKSGGYPTALTALVTDDFLPSVPTDPSSANNGYGYVALPSGCNNSSSMCTSYVLAAILEGGAGVVPDNAYTGSQAITIGATSANCSSTAGIYCLKP